MTRPRRPKQTPILPQPKPPATIARTRATQLRKATRPAPTTPTVATSQALSSVENLRQFIDRTIREARSCAGGVPLQGLEISPLIFGDGEEPRKGAVKLPNVATASAFCQEVTGDHTLAWQYIRGGCQARSHLTCAQADEQGIASAKIFVCGDLAAENEYFQVTWPVHVGTLVVTDDPKQGLSMWIIDGSFSRDLLSIDQWLKHFTLSASTINVEPHHRFSCTDEQRLDAATSMFFASMTVSDHAEELDYLRSSKKQLRLPTATKR